MVKAHFPRGLTHWIMMMIWLVLLSLFCKSTQEENSQEHGYLNCGPQNVTLLHSGQMILLWEDQPSCSAVRDVLIYELVVFRAGQQVNYDEVAVTPDQIESTHYRIWTSFLDLEGASNSVRLRSRYNNHTSPWKEQTFPGKQTLKVPEIFPKDKWFMVGSTVTFYCILPSTEAFSTMYLNTGEQPSTTKINNQTYALTVYLNRASKNTCDHVKCETKTNNNNGACVYIGYPPHYRDLQCETRDLKSVECQWTVRGDTDLPFKEPKAPQLLGSPCLMLSKGRCSQKVEKVDVGERNWTLTAQNEFGMVELSDTADLSKRVHMFAPNGVKVSTVNARSVTLQWNLAKPQYNNLNITCQVRMSFGEISIIGIGLNSTVLNDLIPNWTYNATLRCGSTQHFWKWSEWSKKVFFRTYGEVPDALDVWMHMEGNHTKIIWKMPQAKQSHGHIEHYEVTWRKTTENHNQNSTKVAFNKQSLSLSLTRTKEYIVTVTARNINGSSPPSTITIPSLNPDDPAATSLKARNLKMGFYKFTMKAQTAVGECGATFITAILNSPTDNLIGAVLIPLLTIFGLLSLTIMLCFRHWACIKQKVFPPIPKPMLTSMGEHGCHLLHVDQCHHSEVHIMDVLELQCSEETPTNGYVCKENILFVFANTPKGYYNQPQKKYPPEPLTTTTTELPSLKGLPSSPFGSVFSNPTYNLNIKPGDQLSSSFPELQERKSLQRSMDGYQPQDLTETFNINPTEEDPGKPMSCVFTYVLLPQSLSK
ncbi:leukemia inhibitory factor receptor-like isoform X3 [Eleginops maclovinus]|uniref:leukemia inhibitory factor receptor-like isoform X3 n=1 Tax=Eleginops maclovinus TaxID=56733 RepID=UPI0030801D09